MNSTAWGSPGRIIPWDIATQGKGVTFTPRGNQLSGLRRVGSQQARLLLNPVPEIAGTIVRQLGVDA